ncbi:hypothetical protein C5167_005393 [Papaver somniferum]|uniref:Reticulon-like protein n=1 Tax=Papaver somniferum TaxID=3469 RepID=A0A4Y7JDL6_PAPSO|nr:reticulon-like protein B9 [Papaver somniferum]RZC58090.1 hypothetical protein C5167_005393 [Papaver somniferum]
MPKYAMTSSDSDSETDGHRSAPVRLFHRERSLHSVFGGGRAADLLLWRKRNISAAILMGITVIWFLFEVFEYQFLPLLCHLSITLMLITFIWSNGAVLFNRSPPRIPEMILSESTFKKVASAVHTNLNYFINTIYDIACGKDLKFFLLAIVSLWILSVFGAYFSTLNLIYIGFLCVGTIPALYDRYQDEVDYVASKWNKDMRKVYRRFDSRVLRRIPRGPVKHKK